MAAAVTTAVVLAFCIPLSLYIRSVAYDRAVDGADLQARSLAAELALVDNVRATAHLVRLANGASDTRAAVFMTGGRLVGAVSPAPKEVPLVVRAGHATTTAAPLGGRWIWEPVSDQAAANAVVVFVPASLLTKGVARDWLLLFGGGALLVLIATGLADRISRSIVRPLLELEDATHRLRDGDLEQRVVPQGPYEVAEVGHAVNELADRIEELLANARMAAADLSHRLRTPMTALRLNIEALAEVPRAQLAQDLEELEAAVSRLIRETRNAPSGSANADLVGAVRGRMAFWAVLARSQQRHFQVHAPSCRVEIGLDRDDLDAAIDALLSNIFTHTPEGTAFRVDVRQIPNGRVTWALVVENDPVESPSAPTTGAGTRGTGMGLDIVRRSAQRAGGTVEIGRSHTGGFRVEVRFPVGPRPSANGPTGRVFSRQP